MIDRLPASFAARRRTRKLLVLCDIVGAEGGTESMLSRVLSELNERSNIAIAVRGRDVRDATAFGVAAEEIAWGGDEEPSNVLAAVRVAETIAALRPDTVLLSSVFDPAVVRAARRAPRAIAHVHDHRAFCPSGDRIYPQFRTMCSQKMGAACVVNSLVRGCVEGPRRGTFRRLHARQTLRDALCRLDGINVDSAFMAELCEANGIPLERIAILAPPVDPQALATPPAAMPPERRVLFAGRLVRDKGLDSLVRALAHIPKASRPKLDVAGAPTRESSATVDAARAQGVEIRVLGRQNDAGLVNAIDAARVIAIPSLWPEPFGMMGIEAYARGRPVVAYAVGGIPEWIGDGGIAVRRGDEAAFARAIADVLDEDRWAQFATAARRRALHYTARGHADRLLAILFPD
jgi:hypothetical protein